MSASSICRRAVSLALLLLAILLPSPVRGEGMDFDLPDGSGHFYRQANGRGGVGESGFAITNAGGIPFWDEYRRLGGPDTLGYPVSRRFLWDGFTVQATQKAVLQWQPDSGRVAFANVLDRMHDLGKDGWLRDFRQTPAPFDTAPDTGLGWEEVVDRHLAFLEQNQAIRERFLSNPSWLDHYGLPVSYADQGNCYVIRTQRAVFQQWKEEVPWAKAGEVTIANAGDLAKETALFPWQATLPELPPVVAPAPLPAASQPHDWRAPGFFSAVGGQLFDPRGVPFRSVGTNLPNLAYRDGLAENLEWMRQHHMRWMRVFATGHNLGPDRAPRDADAAVAALRSLLARVEAFNAAHDPAEAIYVLVSLTDYYPPGVPGDRYGYDHPTFQLSPVLPAPWFRAGVRSFDFDQEHGFGKLYSLPNYEVNYKPWVRQLVSVLSQSRVLMGWQLGNELKARNSARNGITNLQAYEWYLAFTRDISDTIRSIDRNHLIFTGTQYMAELVDWEYRPEGRLQPAQVAQYRQLMDRMLGVEGWNVWSLTSYDFNPYPLDDAALLQQAGVAVVATEYGFTRGTPEEEMARFGGDRAAAVLTGLARPWQDLDGQPQPRQWGVPDLFARGLLAGAAPWGSPAPGPGFDLEMDSQRGITGAPDEAALWAAWGEVAAAMEAGR